MLASERKAQTNASGRKSARKGRHNGRADGSSRYEVLERRGEGTLWIVYRVREQADKNGASPMLALKALKQVANRHPRLPGALTQSARRWATLSHPNLAIPRDVNIEDETLYFTTEWLSAPALETRLARGPVPAAQALKWLGEIAGALAYLHERDLAHGDVRPRQILFDAETKPVLTDGGVAESFATAGLALSDVQPEIAHYLAPELSQGQGSQGENSSGEGSQGQGSSGESSQSAGLSGPADVYALGVCFYRMLCGRVPFDGASALAIAARHRNDEVVVPSHYNERVSPAQDALALRLLDKDPAARPTAAQLEELLCDAALPLPAVAGAPATAIADAAQIVEIEPIDGAEASEKGAEIEKNMESLGPKRRPLDEVVAETMSKEAEAKRAEVLQRARKKHKWREFRGAVGALLGLLLLFGALGGMVVGAYNYWLGEIPAEVTVPKYVGLSSDAAKAVLAKEGLKLKVARESYDPKKPEGTVLAGEPKQGKLVREQREVLVTVSAGSAPIKMVDFSKLSLEQARAIILQHGLRLGQSIDQYHPSVPRGYICGQYPEAGEPLRRSEPITLIVSRGPQPTDVDAQKDIGMDQSQSDVIDPTNGVGGNNASGLEALPDGGADFTPLEPATGAPSDADNSSAPANNAAPASNELKSKRATITVKVPRDGGTQVVRIVVRDSNGERTVYQRSRPAGRTVSRTVNVTRPDSDPALVRVYVGDQLLREDSL